MKLRTQLCRAVASDNPVKPLDKAHSIAASPDGSAVFVTGDSQGGTGGDNDYLTIAYVS